MAAASKSTWPFSCHALQSLAPALLLIVYFPPTLLAKEYTPFATVVVGTEAPVAPSTIFGTAAAAPAHGDSKTTSPPTVDSREIGATVPAVSIDPDTRNAPYVRSVLKEAAPRAVTFHTGKNRMRPPTTSSESHNVQDRHTR